MASAPLILEHHSVPQLASFGRALLALAFLYACWIGMEAVHELGHALNAWSIGARVIDVSIPVLGTSQTTVTDNPYSRFITEGGPTWGVAIPVFACGLAYLFRRRMPEPLKFFTGFCCIANGVYMAVGWHWHNTDAGELLRMNVPRAALIAYGVAASAFGFAIWHRLAWLTWKK
jgi:hypothetical protein